MKPIELGERLGRWSAGRGPLPVLLAARLRRLIDEGDLAPGEPLPPDRALAAALAVGRSTVVTAYELLREDGRIVRRQGSGTQVAGAAPAGPRQTTSAPMFLHLLEPQDGVIPLACAAPDTPPPELAAAYTSIGPALAGTTGDIGYYPAGHPVLRRAIADRYTERGIRTSPERILVTNGAQQALSLLARALLAPGQRVLVEGPTYPGALEAFHEQAAQPLSLPAGLGGLAAAARRHQIALAYVISTFHNPTGAVLSPFARRALVRAAAEAGVPLLDDEVLSDLGFPGVPAPPPLAAYADAVISVGSLSKSVWGGLRIGWVRAAEPLIARLARLLAVYDLGGNVPAQLAAAELLPQLDALCRRQAPLRQARHDHLRAQLARLLPGWEAPPVPGGQTLWVRLPHGDGTSFAQTALRHGVAVLPGNGLDAAGRSGNYLRLHFIASAGQLTEAVRRLAEAWRAYQPPGRPGQHATRDVGVIWLSFAVHGGTAHLMTADLAGQVRAICLALPEVAERLSHGVPTWFVSKKAFVTLWAEGHHGDEFPHLWCAGLPGAQAELTASEPGRFFRPPYVGGRGWIGVRLDRDPDWAEIAELCQDAYRVIAPARLTSLLDR